jgi:regulator of cell morphogenesis and NO signaling
VPAANLPVDEVLGSLEMAEQTTRATQKIHDWQREPLSDLVAHINGTHHKYTRDEIARVGPLLEKVCSVHGKNHPELLHIRARVHSVRPLLRSLLMRG